MKKLILASASPRRKELMQLLDYEFEVCPSGCEEVCASHDPETYVKELSKAKAEDIAKSVNEDAIVIGADTVVVFGGQILGKPGSPEEAFSMLHMLAGKKHNVYTGITLIDRLSGNKISFSECTEVEFYPVTDEEIHSYIATGDPFDKAGGYGIQSKGAFLVRAVYGDFYNVVGLPIAALNRRLQAFLSDH